MKTLKDFSTTELKNELLEDEMYYDSLVYRIKSLKSISKSKRSNTYVADLCQAYKTLYRFTQSMLNINEELKTRS